MTIHRLDMQQDEPVPAHNRETVSRDYRTRARIVFALIGACGLTPLLILLFDDDNFPLWQQWVAVAVFTPMSLIIEWIVITGRTTFSSRRRVGGSGDRPPAA